MSSQDSLRVAGVQMMSHPGEVDRNLSAAQTHVQSAAAEGSSIVALPEFFATGYFCQDIDPSRFELAEPVDGRTISFMRELAATERVWILAPFFEADTQVAGRYYNTTAVIGPDGTLEGRTSKRYLPLNVTTERYYFSPGRVPTSSYNAGPMRFGIVICYERHFWEIARLEVLQGAELLILVNSTYRAPNRSGIWEEQLRTLAATNTSYLLAVNSCGEKDQFGQSMVIDPTGRVLSKLGDAEGTVSAELSASELRSARVRNPILRDLRKDVLEQILGLM